MNRPLFVVYVSLTILYVSALHASDAVTQKSVVQPAVVRDAAGEIHSVETATPRQGFDFSGGPDPLWIWATNNPQRCWIRKSFTTAARSAFLIATCDNVMAVTLNGHKVAAGSEWQSPARVDVSKHLKSGTNHLVAEVSDEGGLRGFVLKMVLTDADGTRTFVTSDASWESSATSDFATIQSTKSLGKMGTSPWNDVFSKPDGGNSGSALLKSAVPRNVFQVLPGFQVEELYSVPKATQGSWVSIAFDNKGRLIASDQGGQGLYRITPAAIGTDADTVVEKIPAPITSAQGLLWAFDALYVSVNGGPGSGLYRVTDSDGDDQLDHVQKLAVFRGGGEHGPHGLRLSPDGKSIYCIAGNHTDPPEGLKGSRLRTNWGEDHLLPRQWDARGHARGRLAPGGWIASCDPDGGSWEMISVGYRNPYDFDISPEGEMFSYDADMEWDLGTPWYRPTRINHVVSGSEFGWRSGTGKWPTSYADSLPQVVDIGPGSPVGVTLGTGAKFPAKYQRALYCCDWTFGTMYAVHLTPQGASYVGVKEEFVARTPLPLTDVAIGPDGAMYFTTGGRNAESALFRLTYTGDESTAPMTWQPDEFTELRNLRRRIETLHVDGQSSRANVDFLLPMLGHEDRHIRYAARNALEFQDASLWQRDILELKNSHAMITGCLALARQGDRELRDPAIETLLAVDFSALPRTQQLDYLRALSLLMVRMGEPVESVKRAISQRLDDQFPNDSAEVNAELIQVLVYCGSPTVIGKTLRLLNPESTVPGGTAPERSEQVAIPDVLTRNSSYGGTVAQMLLNMPALDQVHYAFVLRNMKYGWTLEQRKEYLNWFGRTAKWSGGASFHGFMTNIQKDFLANASDAERRALEGTVANNAIKEEELPRPVGPGSEWAVADVLKLTATGLAGRSFENGKRAYAAARCISCHRYLGEGGSTGPDLTNVAGRFSHRDLLDAIIEPSKVISDQYRASIIETRQGKVINGRILSDAEGTLIVLTDPVDVTKTVELSKSDIEAIQASPTSLMPEKLVHPLNRDELLDLLAYLLSRGNPADPAFRASE